MKKKVISYLFLVVFFSLSATFMQVGWETNLQNKVPMYGVATSSWSRTLIKSEELANDMTISKLAFNVVVDETITFNNQTIYFKNSSETNIDNTYFDPAQDESYIEVFNGNVTFVSGWNEIFLDNSFDYNDSSNLEIVWTNQGDNSATEILWESSENIYQDNLASYVYSYIDDINSDDIVTTDIRPNIRFYLSEDYPEQSVLEYPANNSTNIPLTSILSWNCDESDGYNLYFGTSIENIDLVAENILETTYDISSLLDNETTYYWQIRSIQGQNYVNSAINKFTTSASSDIVIIGNEDYDNQYLPFDFYYKHSYSQSIYRYADLNIVDKRIESIQYEYNQNSECDFENIKIYMGLTDLTSFSGSSWYSPEELTLVYDGSLSFDTSTSWVNIMLDTPFFYENTDNLIIACRKDVANSESYNSSFFCSNADENMSLIFVNNYTEADPTLSSVIPTVTNYYPNIKLHVGDVPTGPQLVTNYESYNYGEQPLAVSPQEQEFTLRNNGIGEIVIESISLSDDTDFNIDLGDLSFPLTLSDEIISYTVEFNPLTVGEKEASIEIVGDFSDSGLLINIDGIGYDPTITDFPYEYDFEDVEDGYLPEDWSQIISENSDDMAYVTSYGAYAGEKLLMFNSSYSLNSEFYVSTPPILDLSSKRLRMQFCSLGMLCEIGTSSVPNDSLAFNSVSIIENCEDYSQKIVSFGDINSEDKYIIFKFTSDNYYQKAKIDDMIIEDIPSNPEINLTTNSLDFGEVYQNRSNSQTLSINNCGVGTLNVSFSAENIYSFSLDTFSLASGESEDILVTFSPTTETSLGNYAGSFIINSNDSNDEEFEITTNATILAALPDGVVIIGSGTEVNQSLPLEPNYGNSWSQTLYYPEEINFSNQRVKKISYNYNMAHEWGPDELQIYIGTTTQESLSDWIPVNTLSLVYDDYINTEDVDASGWLEFELDSPFVYSGDENLVIGVYFNCQNYHDNDDEFNCTETDIERSIAYYSDSHIDLNAPHSGMLRSTIPNTKFEFEAIPDIHELTVLPESINFGTVSLDTDSEERNILLTSTGSQAIVIATAPVLSGDNVSEYRIVDDNEYPLTINSLESVDIGVIFAPTDQYYQEASIIFTDDLNEEYEIELKGYGFAPDNNDTIGNATELSYPISEYIASINPIDDVDWYRLSDLCIGDSLDIYGTRPDGLLNSMAWLYGPIEDIDDFEENSYIDSDDNSGSDEQPRIQFAVTEPGDYYLRYAYNYNGPTNEILRKNPRGLQGNKGRDDQSRESIGVYYLNIDATLHYDFNAPYNLTATSMCGYISLEWEEPEYERYLDNYIIYRNGEQLNEIGVEQGTTSYIDYDVEENVEYSYYVVAEYLDPEGESESSNEVSITYITEGTAVFSDDFEQYSPFTTEVYDSEHYWHLVDSDGGDTFGISGVEYDHYGEPAAFMVFNPNETVPQLENADAFSGEQYLMSLLPQSGGKDDWLISPEISCGDITILSFYAKSISAQYDLEKLEVRLSLGGAEIEDFYLELQPDLGSEVVPIEWSKYRYILSGLQNDQHIRLAIHACSENTFGLLIDKFEILGTADNTDIDGSDVEEITGTSLLQNYPNPFNPETTISYHMEKAEHVKINIYNIKGQKVRCLVDSNVSSGIHKVVWNGEDSNQQKVASGIYFYQLQSGKYSKCQKMILMK